MAIFVLECQYLMDIGPVRECQSSVHDRLDGIGFLPFGRTSMNRRSFLAICGGLGAATLLAGEPLAATWVQLAARTVNVSVDHDTFAVSAARGRFRKIQLKVKGNDLFIHDLKVIYANGGSDDIPIRSRIPQGGSSRVIDLRGGKRFIREVRMVYQRPANLRGATIVELWARR